MRARSTVLVVDDDLALSSILMEQLRDRGCFNPITAHSIAEADQALSNADCQLDAIILDVRLPDGDGRNFCHRIRSDGVTIPIVLLTAVTDELDVVRGLDCGADDYVSKPFRLNELLARLQRHIDTFQNSTFAAFQIGPYRFVPAQRFLIEVKTGRRIRLTNNEASILKALQRADGYALRRQDLLEQALGYGPGVITHTLETHVYRLRQKMEPVAARPSILMTCEAGYRLAVKPDLRTAASSYNREDELESAFTVSWDDGLLCKHAGCC